MTDTFDWAGLAYDAVRITRTRGEPHAAAYLRTRIKAAFVTRAEYDKLGMGSLATISDMGTRLGQTQARAEAAEAENARLREALREAIKLCSLAPIRQALGAEHGK